MNHKSLSYNEWKEIPHPKVQGKVDLFLDHMDNIENAGLILRSAEAMAVEKIIFYQPAFEWNDRKIRKISRSTIDQLHIQIMEQRSEVCQLFQKYEQVIALEFTNHSESIYNYNPEFPLLLVIGNEQQGINPSILKQIKYAVHIPMLGKQSSMNVACATTTALGQITKRRIAD